MFDERASNFLAYQSKLGGGRAFASFAARFDNSLDSSKLEDALHSDLRKSLIARTKEVSCLFSMYSEVISRLEQKNAECKNWMERADSLEDIVKDKDEMLDCKDSELTRLRFLIGAREGELSFLSQSAERGRLPLNSVSNDGSAAFVGSPYFNDIDCSAAGLAVELQAVSDDMERRALVMERMNRMVTGLEHLAKEQYVREVASRKEMVARSVQTECTLADMEALCAFDDQDSTGQDPHERHRAVMATVQRRPFLRGVPSSLRTLVGDSRAWLQNRHMRPVAPLDALCRDILIIYFDKMVADHESDQARAPRSTLAVATYERLLARLGRRSLCDLAMLDLAAAIQAHAASPRVALFARFCGMQGPASCDPAEAKQRGPLPVETLNFMLDVLFVLHEEVSCVAWYRPRQRDGPRQWQAKRHLAGRSSTTQGDRLACR